MKTPQELPSTHRRREDQPTLRGRPPSLSKRAAILEAATTLFLRDGFDRTSVDAVAATAHVSKPTVYAHYPGKDGLFRAVVEAARVQAPGPPTRPDGLLVSPENVEQSLIDVGRWFIGILLEPRISALRRLVIAEVGRRPELEDLWKDGDPDRFRTHLARDLKELDSHGILEVDAASQSVEHLISLWAHPTYARTLYGLNRLDPQELTDIVTAAVSLFLRAHRRLDR